MSEIKIAKTAGFCFGVTRAIKTACEAAEKYGKAFTYGPLIHNNDVIAELNEKGVSVTETLEPQFSPVIIRSHGVPKTVYDELAQKQIEYIDATCPFVAKIHQIVQNESQNGADVLIAGDRNHPEVIGILGHAHGSAFAVNSINEFHELLKTQNSFGQNALILVAQTTYDMGKWAELKKIIKKHYTKVKIFDTICLATTNRQTEADELSKESDLMIVIGGSHSSNSRKLAEICSRNTETLFVENGSALDRVKLKSLLSSEDVKIGITAGINSDDKQLFIGNC